MPAPLLVCAAVEEELARLLPRLVARGGEVVVAGRAAVWEGQLGGRHVVAAPVGIGPVDAALGAARLLGEAPAAAVFVGTCGAFPGSGLSIGQAVVVEWSCLTASDAAAGLSYVPGPAQVIARSDVALASALSLGGVPLVGCATTVAITRDAERARQLAAFTGCAVEHLEAHAFLRAAALAGVPAACVLGVANEVGPNAHAEWKAHGAEASAAAVAVLERWLGV